jgi:cation diffusion facilitator family transporter
MVASGSRRFAWLSIAAAIATIAMKLTAWRLTDSVGLLSDALEAGVNLAGATAMLAMLIVAARPADDEHAFGYSKAEYFSSGFEGTLILGAAIAIGIVALDRLFAPRPLTNIGPGLAVSVAAALINFAVARRLIEASRHYHSIALEADAQHLMTDVWTSIGVIAGVGAVALTGWQRLDPLIALAVAAHILWSGTKLVKRSALGLLDRALPPEQLAALGSVLEHFRARGIDFHAVRTRGAGTRSFVSLHVLVPGDWTVTAGHDLAEAVEAEIRAALPGASVFTHLEPLGDPASYRDINLDR